VSVVKEGREQGRLTYLVRGSGRVTWLVVRHLGNGEACLHWISAACRAGANPEIALHLALGTRRKGKRARPGCADVTIAQLQKGEFGPNDFPRGVYAVLRSGLSNHDLVQLRGGSNQPEPSWAMEPEPLWQDVDGDHVEQWRPRGVIEAPDGGVDYLILPARSSSEL
jgi:hypothetical protein